MYKNQVSVNSYNTSNIFVDNNISKLLTIRSACGNDVVHVLYLLPIYTVYLRIVCPDELLA